MEDARRNVNFCLSLLCEQEMIYNREKYFKIPQIKTTQNLAAITLKCFYLTNISVCMS